MMQQINGSNTNNPSYAGVNPASSGHHYQSPASLMSLPQTITANLTGGVTSLINSALGNGASSGGLHNGHHHHMDDEAGGNGDENGGGGGGESDSDSDENQLFMDEDNGAGSSGAGDEDKPGAGASSSAQASSSSSASGLLQELQQQQHLMMNDPNNLKLFMPQQNLGLNLAIIKQQQQNVRYFFVD